MLRFFENDTATLGQMLGQRILKCKLSSAVIALIASVQVMSPCLLIQEAIQLQTVLVVIEVLVTGRKRLNTLSRLVVVVVMVVIDSVMVFQF